MGTYLNPGKAAYEEAVNSEIFVDKTEMIGYLNSVARTKKKYVCVSRPRRFGKTMAADMLCAYYDRKAESRELFEKRKIAVCATALAREREVPWDEYMGQFDVIRLVMTDFFKSDQSIADALDTIKVRVLDELEECYPGTKYDVKDFPFSMDKFYRKSGRQFVIVIDEWDAVFRMLQDDAEGQRKYLDFLRDWLKDKPYVALAYMTGILPIKKYGKHSALNMFTEYSMEAPRQLAQYTGFTEDEVEKLCMDYGMNYADISNWYNGYVVSDRIPPEKREEYRQGKYDGHKIHIYSPLSVVESMTTGQIKNYWNKTETYEALAEYIRKALCLYIKQCAVFYRGYIYFCVLIPHSRKYSYYILCRCIFLCFLILCFHSCLALCKEQAFLRLLYHGKSDLFLCHAEFFRRKSPGFFDRFGCKLFFH